MTFDGNHTGKEIESKKAIKRKQFNQRYVRSEDISAEGFLRSGSIKPHRSVTFVAADIRSVAIHEFSQRRISDPLRCVTHHKFRSAP